MTKLLNQGYVVYVPNAKGELQQLCVACDSKTAGKNKMAIQELKKELTRSNIEKFSQEQLLRQASRQGIIKPKFLGYHLLRNLIGENKKIAKAPPMDTNEVRFNDIRKYQANADLIKSLFKANKYFEKPLLIIDGQIDKDVVTEIESWLPYVRLGFLDNIKIQNLSNNVLDGNTKTTNGKVSAARFSIVRKDIFGEKSIHPQDYRIKLHNVIKQDVKNQKIQIGWHSPDEDKNSVHLHGSDESKHGIKFTRVLSKEAVKIGQYTHDYPLRLNTAWSNLPCLGPYTELKQWQSVPGVQIRFNPANLMFQARSVIGPICKDIRYTFEDKESLSDLPDWQLRAINQYFKQHKGDLLTSLDAEIQRDIKSVIHEYSTKSIHSGCEHSELIHLAKILTSDAVDQKRWMR